MDILGDGSQNEILTADQARLILEQLMDKNAKDMLSTNPKLVRGAIDCLTRGIISYENGITSKESKEGEVGLERGKDYVALEGRVAGKFGSLMMPLGDWKEGANMAAIGFSFIEDGRGPVRIENTEFLATKMDKSMLTGAVRGSRWLIKNLLEWNGKKLWSIDEAAGNMVTQTSNIKQLGSTVS